VLWEHSSATNTFLVAALCALIGWLVSLRVHPSVVTA